MVLRILYTACGGKENVTEEWIVLFRFIFMGITLHLSDSDFCHYQAREGEYKKYKKVLNIPLTMRRYPFESCKKDTKRRFMTALLNIKYY